MLPPFFPWRDEFTEKQQQQQQQQQQQNFRVINVPADGLVQTGDYVDKA